LKRILYTIIPLLIVFSYCTSHAQVFYEYPDAPAVPESRVHVGSYLAVGENDLFRVGGYGRLGFIKYFDAGIEFLLDSVNSKGFGGIGADAKLQLLPTNRAVPFDLAANVGVGFRSGAGLTIIQAPLGGIVSSPFKLDSGTLIVPYLGAYVLIINTKVDRGPNPDLTDTDVDAELRTGVRVRLTPTIDLFGTVHVGRDALFSLGLNYQL
jgi:hypothetical protein